MNSIKSIDSKILQKDRSHYMAFTSQTVQNHMDIVYNICSEVNFLPFASLSQPTASGSLPPQTPSAPARHVNTARF